MDEKRNRKTINIADFQVGDLVIIAGSSFALDEESTTTSEPHHKRTYGIIIKDTSRSRNFIDIK